MTLPTKPLKGEWGTMVTLKNCLTRKEDSLFPFGRSVTQTHHPSPDFCIPVRSSTSCAALSGTPSMLLCTDVALCSWWDFSGVQKPQHKDSDQLILILDDLSKARKKSRNWSCNCESRLCGDQYERRHAQMWIPSCSLKTHIYKTYSIFSKTMNVSYVSIKQ